MVNPNVTDETLRHHILSILSRGTATATAIADEIYGTDKTTFAPDVTNQGKVLGVLMQLKHEHRVLPDVNDTWIITSKGKKSYG